MRDILDNAAPLLSAQRWKARLLLWLAGATIGVAAVGFAKLADLAQQLLRHLMARSALWPLMLAPVGFFVIAWVTRRYFRGAEGSGIPQTIHTLQPEGVQDADVLMRARIVLARVGLACLGLVCGGSIGREGPTVHVGAAIAYAFGRWIPHRELDAQRHVLILAGGAAGVAAAFNTPLAGIVFAIEELARSFEERANGVTLTTVVLAGIVAMAIAGDYTYFGQPEVGVGADRLSLGVLVTALASGVAGGLFSRVTLAGVRGLPGAIGRWQQRQRAQFALGCGVLVAVTGWLSGGLTYGSGYVEAKSVMVANAHLPWLYAPARGFATLLSYLSGVPCGLFAPSLSTGAGLGQTVADLMHQSSAVPFAILGMGGYLAAVTQAPITSLVIVLEMTTQHQMVFPLAVTIIIATAVSRLMSPPLYRTLAERYRR